MRRPYVTIISVLLAALLLPVGSTIAGKFYSHRQRTRTKCCLPEHDYNPIVWPFTTPQSFGATEIAVAATDPTAGGRQRKPFHFRATALTVDQLTLDQVGLTLYRSDGQLIATGRITHSGGDGGLIGNNVTIRVRAYVDPTNAAPASPLLTPVSTAGDTCDSWWHSNAAPAAFTSVPETLPPPAPESVSPSAPIVPVIASPNEPTRIPPDAYVVWRSEHKFWVSRGRPQYISLVPSGKDFPQSEKLIRHFDEITHLEVELEYKRDR